jgi:hypothetical protein
MRRLARYSALVLFLSPVAAAQPTDPVYNVNSITDAPDAAINSVCETASGNGVCTLRAAVMEANVLSQFAQQATINVPAGLYTFTRAIGAPDDESNGDLNLKKEIRILGAGSGLSIIDANHLDRVFAVHPGAEVTLADLSIQGGRPPAGVGRTFLGNGGGIAGEGILTLLRCLVTDNVLLTSERTGGGIHWQAGPLTLVDSVVRLNSAPGGLGGGIYSRGKPTSITRSTVSGNSAGNGGGIVHSNNGSGESLRMVNSTISQNTVSGIGGGLTACCGIPVFLSNVTVAENTAPGGSAAVYFSTVVTLSNSVFSGEFGCSNGASSVMTTGTFSNLIQNKSPTCSITGLYLVGDPLLGPLGSHGGSTATHPLLAGSPAIDSLAEGDCIDALGAVLSTDQRGVKRPIGFSCDLGAFEKEPIGDANGDGVVSVLDVFSLINFLFAGGAIPLGRANVNGDSAVTVLDVFHLINHLFAGGPAPV